MTGEINQKEMAPFIAVVGPTGSGKSALGVKLAEIFGGEVINLDSVQCFKGMDIGSGKIGREEMRGIPHHLIDIAKPHEQLNVGMVMELADRAILDILARGKRPIIVAGTTLYLKCLLNGLVDIPGEDPEFRKGIAAISTEELFEKLKKVDPARANQVLSGDRMRISRSLEIIEATGKPHSVLIAEHQHNEKRYSAIVLNLCWPRERLYERIDSRCRKMVEDGLLTETESILEEYGKVHSFNTLGYAQALSVLEGTLNQSDLLSEMQIKTRQFAKRQLSFWRNQPQALNWKVFPEPEQGELLKSKDKALKKGAMVLDSYVINVLFDELTEMLKAGFRNGQSTVEVWNIGAERISGSM